MIRMDHESFNKWLKKRTIFNIRSTLTFAELYEDFNEWINNNNEFMISKNSFAQELYSYHEIRKSKSGSVRYVRGIELLGELK